jgi:hypothetical protein
MSQVIEQEYIEEDYGVYQMAITNQNNQDSTCWGCREGALNQVGHMDYGGCLYFEEDDLSDDESIIETQSIASTVIDSDTDEEIVVSQE